MRKIIRPLVLLLVAAFIVLQFFQAEKNNTAGEETGHLFEMENVPPGIQSILKEACLDCHSNTTRYTWYHHISPVSFWVKEHIENGKSDLNFSEWKDMDVFEKITILEEVCQETERKSMPLKSYTLMHPKAKLSEEQIAELCAWTSKLSEDLLEKATKE